MFKKIKAVVIFFIISLILFPQVIFAEGSIDSKVPELNPLCFTQDECAKLRKQRASESNITIGEDEAKGGFVADEGDCNGKTSDNKQWGKCLAGGQTVAEISIGGKSKFKDMGDYVATVYNYVLGIASIMAVVIIIIAGIQWIVSAGNSETISSAKKRISGALIGLVLAYGSYLILNTINPNLVKLRLPQSWMLKKVELVPEFCRDISKKETRLALIKYSANGTVVNKNAKDLTSADDFKYSLLPKDEKSLVCNGVFAPDGGGGATCIGHYCFGDYVCLPNLDDSSGGSSAQKYKCQDAIIGGKIINTSLQGGSNIKCVPGTGSVGWSYPWMKIAYLKPVCANGALGKSKWKFIIKELDEKKGVVTFRLPLNGKTKAEFLFDISSGCMAVNPVDTIANINKSQEIKNENGEKVIDIPTNVVGFVLLVALDKNCVFWEKLHILGKGGLDVGVLKAITIGDGGLERGYFSPDVKFYNGNIPTNNLITPQDLLKGIYMNIDVSNINSD